MGKGMNTGRWYNGITSVSKTENRSSILRRPAALLLVLALIVGCSSPEPSSLDPFNLEGRDHLHYTAVVIVDLDRNAQDCSCEGIGRVVVGNVTIDCPFHPRRTEILEEEPASLSDENVPFKPQQVPSE